MAIPITHFGLLVTVLIAGIMTVNTHLTFDQAPPPAPGLKQRCSDMFNFMKYCSLYMHRYSPRFHKPNEKCCTSARKVRISLFCKIFLIKETEKIFNPFKVAVVAKYCGNPLPRYTKCGSYIVRRSQPKAQKSDSLKNNFHASNNSSLGANVECNSIFVIN